MNRRAGIRRGFTLVEVIIATALGMTVALTALAALRVAQQSVTTAARLEVETAMIRTGCLRAFEQVDFWTDLDRPGDYEPLRGTRDGRGLPFTPLSVTVPPARADDPEDQRGWDDSERAWAPHDARAWYRGSMVERSQTVGSGQDANLRFGRYAISTGCDPVIAPAAVDGQAYGAGVRVPYRWRCNLQRSLIDAMGWYGFIEYLPANTIFGWHQDRADGVTTIGGLALACIEQDWSRTRFCLENSNQGSRGRYRCSHRGQFAIADPRHPAADPFIDHYHWYSASFASSPDDMREFDRVTTVHTPLLATQPATWPRATVAITRYVMNARAAAIARVRWTSPVTGMSGELSFANWGTTLRGARRQRAHPAAGGGWADWHDDGRPEPRTLDSP